MNGIHGVASLLYRNCDAGFPGWAGRELAATGLQAQILAQGGATAADAVNAGAGFGPAAAEPAGAW